VSWSVSTLPTPGRASPFTLDVPLSVMFPFDAIDPFLRAVAALYVGFFDES